MRQTLVCGGVVGRKGAGAKALSFYNKVVK